MQWAWLVDLAREARVSGRWEAAVATAAWLGSSWLASCAAAAASAWEEPWVFSRASASCRRALRFLAAAAIAQAAPATEPASGVSLRRRLAEYRE